jgi:hypothetical protein
MRKRDDPVAFLSILISRHVYFHVTSCTTTSADMTRSSIHQTWPSAVSRRSNLDLVDGKIRGDLVIQKE